MADWRKIGSRRKRASVTLNGILSATASLTSPPAPFSTVLNAGVLPAGTYTVTWTVSLSGTIAAAEANNFILNLGPSIFIANSVNPAAAGSYPQAPVTITSPGGLALLILSGANNATSGAVYGATAGTTGNGSVGFDADSGNHKWVIEDIVVATSQAQNTAPYPTATAYLTGQQVGVSEGASWIGNQDTMRGQVEIGPCETLTVAFSGGVPGSVATAIAEGDSFLWR